MATTLILIPGRTLMAIAWSAERSSGAAMIAGILAGTAALAHHPVLDHARAGSAAAALRMVDGVNAWVHGAAIAATVLLAACLATYTQLRGWQRALPRSAAVLFGVGAVLMVQAGLIDGFIAPALIRNGAIAAGADPIARLLWASNQALTVLASTCIAAAMALWSLDLLRNPPVRRVLGLIGLVLAAATAVVLVRADGSIGVAQMQLLWALIGGWCLLPALVLVGSAQRDG
jgi:hypothetical protein